MVEWSAFGERPPMSREDWEREFEKYKQFPEYKQYLQINYSVKTVLGFLVNFPK